MVEHTGHEAWEDELYLSLRRSRNLAWIVASASMGLAALAVVAIVGLTPLKSIEPIIITVDKNTGLANVASKFGVLSLDDDEALTQSLIYRYVRDRETYDLQDVRERMEAVWKVSRGFAQNEIVELYSDDNINNPVKVYGNRAKIAVKIQSVVLTGEEKSPDGKTLGKAQVRLQKTLFHTKSGEKTSRNYVVTMTYGFDREGTMTLEERWFNPVGFFVSDYRIDQEAK